MMRLASFDYATPGAYFVTICIEDRRSLFGEIKAGEMRLNRNGKVVQDELIKSVDIRKEIELDKFIIMPDHIHIIIWIVGAHGYAPVPASVPASVPVPACVPAPQIRAHDHAPLRRPPKSISSFVAGFKYGSTVAVGEDRLWQRNYYDRIIRNETELHAIRKCVEDNPLKWESDPENIKQKTG